MNTHCAHHFICIPLMLTCSLLIVAPCIPVPLHSCPSLNQAPLSEYNVEDFENAVAWWNAGKDQMYHYTLVKSPDSNCIVTGVMNVSNESEVVISDHSQQDQVCPHCSTQFSLGYPARLPCNQRKHTHTRARTCQYAHF